MSETMGFCSGPSDCDCRIIGLSVGPFIGYPLKGGTDNPLIQQLLTHGSMQKPID